MARTYNAVYVKSKAIEAETRNEMSHAQRVRRMLHLMERIERCKAHLKTISTERS
jgi:hypothetical protein